MTVIDIPPREAAGLDALFKPRAIALVGASDDHYKIGGRPLRYMAEAGSDVTLDEMFVKINGDRHYLWRAVDHEGEVLESFVTKTRDKKAALKFLKKAMKKHGRAGVFVTDKLRSYGAALKDLRVEDRQETGRWLNNRVENSHLPFRRRERAMLRFRRMRSLQSFAAVHASVTNHFNLERSLSSRPLFKANRAAALAEWRGLCAA